MNKSLKLIFTLFLVALFLFYSTNSVLAKDSSSSSNFRSFREEFKEQKEKIKEERKELKEQKKEQLKENKLEFKNIFNFLKNNNISIINGNVAGKSDSSLTVNKDGKDYIVNITSNTKIVRRFFGKATLSEISVGDKINIIGNFTNDEKTVIEARLIRDLSITKRHAVFIGKVVSKTTDSFVIDPEKRDNQTVVFNSNTKFVNREQKTITFEDIKIGDRVRVKGVWDQSLNKITESLQVKDFSLPEKVED